MGSPRASAPHSATRWACPPVVEFLPKSCHDRRVSEDGHPSRYGRLSRSTGQPCRAVPRWQPLPAPPQSGPSCPRCRDPAPRRAPARDTRAPDRRSRPSERGGTSRSRARPWGESVSRRGREIGVARRFSLDPALLERGSERVTPRGCLELGLTSAPRIVEPRSQQLFDCPHAFGNKISRPLARLSTLEVAR